MKRRFPDASSNIEAKFEAQKLAFGPMMFQAARTLRDTGVLEFLVDQLPFGATPETIHDHLNLSIYAARVLLEGGLAANMLQLDDGVYRVTKVGYLILRDPMTRVNMDFVHDVCYRAMFHFDQSIAEGRPVGLAEHGQWKTIYDGLSELPETAQRSWFAFDHYYSDGVFERALPKIFSRSPRRILDVGGNTGKFAFACCTFDPAVEVTIIDLPGQIAVALNNAQDTGFASRVSGQSINLLDSSAVLPSGFDAIWMSQFLDCFGEDEVIRILTRAASAMGPEARLYILETYWDRQEHEAARYSVINTSLYFTAVANGNSKMFSFARMLACLAAAGLTIEEDFGEIGFHTLLRCKRRRTPVS